MSERCIPEEWIKGYVDQWLLIAEKLGPGKMQDAALLRADHAMDLVKAYRMRNDRPGVAETEP